MEYRIYKTTVILLTILLWSLSTPGVGESAPPEQAPPGPVQVGEIENLELEVNYLNESGWTQMIHHPNAAYIKVHFLELSLKPGDYVTVSNSSGTQVHKYPSPVKNYTTDGGEGFWALSILDDTAVIELHTGENREEQEGSVAAPDQSNGITIDKYARGYPPEELLQITGELSIESTCGTNERTDVACYQSTYPTEHNRANAVAMHLLYGIELCTAWRAGPSNRMFTNEHCITSQAQLDASEFWFNYQRPFCGSGDPSIAVTQVTGNSLLLDNDIYDFALFTVNGFGALSGFGYLDLDVRTPILGEQIYIPQHGAGNPKEFGIESDFNSGNICRIDDAITNGYWYNTDTGYFCDTIGGSSGSPVLARTSHKVIALHHGGPSGIPCSGTTMNQGVRIDQIWPLVQPYLEGGVAAGDIIINELDGGSSDAVELYNASGQAIDLTAWNFRAYNDGSLNVDYTFPVFTLQPRAYVVLREAAGTNTTTDIYMNRDILWDPSSASGAAMLLDDRGVGVDFIRFDASTISPPAGTSWTGSNPTGPFNDTLARDSASIDTDAGNDWCAQINTLGEQNIGCESARVIINELDPGAPNSIELYNAGNQALNMAGWNFKAYDDAGAVDADYTFPSFTLQPGSYVVLYETSGTNTATNLYLNDAISWVNGGSGAAVLLDSSGTGVDFVRFGNSSTPPPPGTNWIGYNSASPPSNEILGRDSASTDTDNTIDWCVQEESLGTQNLADSCRSSVHLPIIVKNN